MSKSLEQIMTDMKAMGGTIHVTPAIGRETGFSDSPAGLIRAEAKRQGMSYGDEEDNA